MSGVKESGACCRAVGFILEIDSSRVQKMNGQRVHE
jgi:hypothetical protein